jgi:hypothetical protein
MGKMLDYENLEHNLDKAPNFHEILENYSAYTAQVLNCEEVVFAMLDEPSKELI